MRLSGSYIGENRIRQSSVLVRPLMAGLLAACLGGCGALGLPFGGGGGDRDLTTGSVGKTSAKSDSKVVAQSDWETIRQSIAQAEANDALSQAMAWSNPATGSTGTLTVLDTVPPTNDPNCRNFQTTVNDLRGIRHYRGEACRMAENRWELFGVLADDSKLL